MDPKEIAASVLDALARLRVLCPTFRLGQMISGIVETVRDERDYGIYDVEDEDFAASLERWATVWAERARQMNAE